MLQTTTSVNAMEQRLGGITTPFTSQAQQMDIDMKKIGEARTSLMDIKLTQVSFCFHSHVFHSPVLNFTVSLSLSP